MKTIEETTDAADIIGDGIWRISTGELAQLFDLTVRRIQQLGQEGVFRSTGRNQWDGTWCTNAHIGMLYTGKMTPQPPLLTRVALGWLSGVLIGQVRNAALTQEDIGLWQGFCSKRGFTTEDAFLALGAARQILGR